CRKPDRFSIMGCRKLRDAAKLCRERIDCVLSQGSRPWALDRGNKSQILFSWISQPRKTIPLTGTIHENTDYVPKSQPWSASNFH
ncbi:MAG: hypothetical protein AAF327_22815, partial [Cyanobacteria bacterium P01_A01_bin.37]